MNNISRTPAVKIYQDPQNPPPPVEFLRRGVRHGMWVMTHDGVGIVIGLSPYGDLEVMLVNSDGTNRFNNSYKSNQVSQARLDQIPPKRQPAPEIAAALGYF